MKSLKNPNFSAIFYDTTSRNDDFYFSGSISSDKFGVIDMTKENQCLDVSKYTITLLYGENTDWIKNCLLFYGSNILYLNDKKKVKEIFEIGGPVYFKRLFDVDENKTAIDRAYYSSTGPGNKDLLKPDEMGPGES